MGARRLLQQVVEVGRTLRRLEADHVVGLDRIVMISTKRW